MKHEGIQAIVGAAIVDSDFRQHLLEDAESVIDEFTLTPDEASVMLSVNATTFQGLATQLQAWIASKSSVPVVCS